MIREFTQSLVTNDVVARAVKTFVQTFLSALALGVTEVVDFSSAKALLLSAGAAGLSAIWNSVLNKRR